LKTIQITWRNYLLPPVHPEGPGFLAVFVVATLILWWIWSPLGWLGVILTIWCYYFFRDPDRFTPSREGLVISPADGIVQQIDEASAPPELDMGNRKFTRVSIFMSVFNCHVNRIPIGGVVVREEYIIGKFLNASLDKASSDNERQALHIKTNTGKDFAVVQIAGLVARRILCDVQDGQEVLTGERFGMIRFGSRVDVYLPRGVSPLVVCGQKMIGGETIIANEKSREGAREAEIR